ncbi:MAG: hypothetical protein RLZZ628_3241 [Bacteroidota bacterium]|jgi:guanidinoacetate N-methyltransferase
MFNEETHPLNKMQFFDKKSQWIEQQIVLTDTELVIAGHPVMQRWETPYMKKLAKIVTQKHGKVLEIGYGLGISANFIQESNIGEHHIIEANKYVYDELCKFALRSTKKTYTYFGFWEDITQKFSDESFDGILFDTYPIVKEELHNARFTFFKEAYRLLKKGGIFTHYSGEVEFTNEYKTYIYDAGFTTFSGELIEIRPPDNCQYWDEHKILAPTFIKT